MGTKIVLKKDYAYTEDVKKAGDLGLLGVAVPIRWIRNGVCINDVGLRLHFWCNRIFLNCLAHGIGTMPITLYGTEAQNKNMYLN
jgi:hypothetical protein